MAAAGPDGGYDLASIVTTVMEPGTFPAKTGTSETRTFGEDMRFRFSVKSGGSKSTGVDRPWAGPHG